MVRRTRIHSVAKGGRGTICQTVGGDEVVQAAASTWDVMVVQTCAVMSGSPFRTAAIPI